MKLFDIIFIIIILVGVFILGWAGNEIYENISYHKLLDGVYLENYNYEQKNNYTNNRDSGGDWVCVNVRGMDFSRGLEVCQHECGHAVYSEIYAELCEKDFSKCMGDLK